jgi:hypothetical protein
LIQRKKNQKPTMNSHEASTSLIPESNTCTMRRYASLALEITEQEWSMLGLEDELCPNVAASNNQSIATERIVSLILIRLVALAAPSHQYSNLSTTCVCQTILRCHNMSCWPDNITDLVVKQLQKYVTNILSGYRRVPYHNFEHAYQVIISSNKLMDLILQSQSTGSLKTSSTKLRFDEDPLMHLALLFAALIHDVDHQGVPNQQLVIENDPLALQYNDRSVAEQQSLSIAFTELLKENYDDLRIVMFPFTFSGDGYRRFRGAVANLVLATDIASPEQGEVVKKKWAAAFSGKTSKQAPKMVPKKRRKKKKTSSTPVLQPPKDHPISNRHRKAVVETSEEQKELERKRTRDSWVELGETPSTHFPSDTITDSLHFWWFCATKETDHEGEQTPTSGDSSSEAFTFHEEQPCDSGSYEGDLDASLTLITESSASEDNAIGPVFQDIYPSASQTFNWSDSTLDNDDSQHLLSPKKVHRSSRIAARSSSMLSPENRRLKPAYCDMRKISIDEEQALAKPKGLLSPFSKKRKDESSPKKDSRMSPTKKDPSRSNMLVELESMLKSFRTVDLVASAGTLDLTTTENASSFASSSALGFDPEDREATIEHMVSEDETSCMTHNTEEEPEPDVELCTSALLEHILLVADVAHNMQGWRLMVRWSDRLGQEMKKAIGEGRCGGMVKDPLEEWYDNQLNFLQGYVLPLAERLEKTGLVPRLADSEGPFLSSHVQSNCKRWRKQGDMVVSAWKDRREKRKNGVVTKKKQIGRALKGQSSVKATDVLSLHKANGSSNMQEVDCSPSRGDL